MGPAKRRWDREAGGVSVYLVGGELYSIFFWEGGGQGGRYLCYTELVCVFPMFVYEKKKRKSGAGDARGARGGLCLGTGWRVQRCPLRVTSVTASGGIAACPPPRDRPVDRARRSPPPGLTVRRRPVHFLLFKNFFFFFSRSSVALLLGLFIFFCDILRSEPGNLNPAVCHFGSRRGPGFRDNDRCSMSCCSR